MKRRGLHQAFEIGIVLKGLHALVECAGGIALYVVSTATIVRWVNAVTQEELIEDPHDFVATHLRHMAQHFSVSAQSFYALYLLGHGVIKLLLVAGLLRHKRWSYPASLAALLLFVLYQLYRYSFTHSVGLLALTAFDLLVIALIWQEWRTVRRAELRAAPSGP